MRNCEYILEAIYTLREYEEDVGTRRALSAAILAMTDEHRRHSGENPLLQMSIIAQGEDPATDDDDTEPPDQHPCYEVPHWVHTGRYGT